MSRIFPMLACSAGLTIAAVALLSPYTGLGFKESFVLYQWFGITRSAALYASLPLIAVPFANRLWRTRFASWCRVLTATRKRQIVAAFCLSLAVRAIVIAATPSMDRAIDLEIYVNTGRLVHAGIDPYDYSDGMAYRAQLRARTRSDYVKQSQAVWDYYASSNLPLSSLYWGLIDAGHVGMVERFHRMVYAIVDSVAATLIFIFCLSFWPARGGLRASDENDQIGQSRFHRACAALVLGPICPAFILWGTYRPEDKGMQTLLMIAGSMCLFAAPRYVLVFLGPCLLGLSIAFKALGALLVPMYLLQLHKRLSSLPAAITAVVIIAITSTIWFVPYSASVFQVMYGRLIGAAGSRPAANEAMWVAIERLLPLALSDALRLALVATLTVLVLYAYFKQRIDIFYVTGTCLFAFVAILIKTGSPDRIGIGVLVAICLMGLRNPGDAERLAFAQAFAFVVDWLVSETKPSLDSSLLTSCVMVGLSVFFLMIVSRRIYLNTFVGADGAQSADHRLDIAS